MTKDAIITVEGRIWSDQLKLLPPVVQKRAENFKLLLEKASERGIIALTESEALVLVNEIFPIMGKRTKREYSSIIVVLLERKKQEDFLQDAKEIGSTDEVECAVCWNDDDSTPYEGIPSVFEKHLIELHGISLAQYFERYPNERFKVLKENENIFA